MSVVKLGSNIASLSAQRRLSDSTRELSHTYERLASGLRINRASDDAAGLSISQSLRADAKIFTQGLRNLNDGISLFNIAESAIEQLSNITVRLKELADRQPTAATAVRKEKHSIVRPRPSAKNISAFQKQPNSMAAICLADRWAKSIFKQALEITQCFPRESAEQLGWEVLAQRSRMRWKAPPPMPSPLGT